MGIEEFEKSSWAAKSVDYAHQAWSVEDHAWDVVGCMSDQRTLKKLVVGVAHHYELLCQYPRNPEYTRGVAGRLYKAGIAARDSGGHWGTWPLLNLQDPSDLKDDLYSAQERDM